MKRYLLPTFAVAALLSSSPAHAQSYSFVDVEVPSDAAGSEGVAVRIAAPSSSRFLEGAPVAIYVPGGNGADAYEIRDHNTGGIIEITFAFPGGEVSGRRSGGTYDQRGPLSLLALADVVEFAIGRTRLADGRSLSDCLAYPALSNNVGLVGWSRGGDATIDVLARFPNQTRGIAWIVTHESPGFDSAMLGEITLRSGATYAPADYVPGTCALLACEVQYPGLRSSTSRAGTVSLYLDRDGSGRMEGTEPAIPATLLAGSTRRVFSMSATEAASTNGVFGARWPASIATVAEARAHWAWRDVRNNLADLLSAHPGLAVMLHATSEDHAQSSPDHAHVALVYNTLQLGGARWVRINPDAAYTASVAASLPDNDANAPLPSDLTSWLIPEASSNDTKIVQAGLYELTDRTRFGRWDANLGSTVR